MKKIKNGAPIIWVDKTELEFLRKYAKIEKIYLYNFKKHKGYGTKEHIEALKKYGKSDKIVVRGLQNKAKCGILY